MFFVHEAHVDVFNRDMRICCCQLTSQLVPKVIPLVGDFSVQICYLFDRLPSPVASLFPSGNFPLCNPQIAQKFLQPSGVVNQANIASSYKRFQSDINSDSGTLSMLRDSLIRDFHHQADVPFFIHLFDNDMLDIRTIRDLAVKNDFNFNNILDIEPDLSIFLIAQFAAISVAIFNAFEAIIVFEFWKSRCFTCLDPTEESRKRLIQLAQNLLNTGRI